MEEIAQDVTVSGDWLYILFASGFLIFQDHGMVRGHMASFQS
jgi:hypothetical protein